MLCVEDASEFQLDVLVVLLVLPSLQHSLLNHPVHHHSLESESTFRAPHFLAHTLFVGWELSGSIPCGGRILCLGCSGLLLGSSGLVLARQEGWNRKGELL